MDSQRTDPPDRQTLVISRHPLTPGGLQEVLRLALPSMAAFATNVIMNLVDTLMVARVQSGAVGAVSNSAMLFHAVLAFFGGATAAIVTFTSQTTSRGDPEDASRYAWQGIYMGLVVGLVGLLIVPLLPLFFALVGHDSDVQGMEVAYMTFRVPSLLFVLLTFSLRSFFQGLGRTRLIFAVTVVSNAMNVLLNWLLIFGIGPFPRMGVAGAGLATLLSIVIGALIYLVPFLFGRAVRENGTRRMWRPSFAHFIGLVRVGLPTSFQWSLDILAWWAWHALLVARLGKAAFDANGVVMECNSMAWFPVIGLGHAVCSLVGWYIARGEVENVRRAARSAVLLAVLYMGAVAVLFLVAADQLIGLFFRPQEGISAEQVAATILLGAAALRVAALWQVFDGVCITLLGALRGAGDTLFAALVMLGMSWFFFLPLAYVLCFVVGWGMPGAWWAGVIHLGLLSGILTLRYRGTQWLKKNIFKDREELPPVAG
jgi:MATE family multidrug resistance protein